MVHNQTKKQNDLATVCYVSISKLRKLQGHITHCLWWAFWERPPGFPPHPPGLLRECWNSQPGSEPLIVPMVPWRCCPWPRRRRPLQPFCSCFDFPLSHELSVHVTSARHHNHHPYSRALPRPYVA